MNITINCECGRELTVRADDASLSGFGRNREVNVSYSVEPCENCMKEARQEGAEEAKKE